MDNASNCVKSRYLVEQQWPHIFYTRCTCHCLDLLFIGKLAWVKPILDNALKVVTFVTMKPIVLALFRKFSAKNLVKPAQTRFAYIIYRVYNGLCSMMNAREIVSICSPISRLLPLADREGATMGLIYELTNRMIEKISALESIDSQTLEEVRHLCIARWDMLHSPLHAAGFVLHPIWREKAPQMDAKIHNGWRDVLERFTHGDVIKQGKTCDELDALKSINWSTLSMIQTKRRHSYFRTLYIHTNLHLINKINERGFEKVEVTLDMIEKEEHDKRLLTLQEENDESHANEDANVDIEVDDDLDDDLDDKEEEEAARDRITRGYAALALMERQCHQAYFQESRTKRWLFDTSVTPTLMYGAAIWGPGLATSVWTALERPQILMIARLIRNKPSVPHDIIRAELAAPPMLVEALFQTV
ncbi:hypothetical protein KP509_22G071500 [Ceratopteris richardii]|uniref:DUF659 domain-containing protein n=1 Tax=Ceratopteris richardii TaxID=49495 RepID=A0A8T2S955_CERRI|nr:hypothetical protein KP509_22G071500 [Ceratopteris richardii]